MTSPVRYSLDAGLATVELAQPERRNVLSFELADALLEALDRTKTDKAKVVLLCAEGKAFCAGMDLKKIALDNADEAAKFSGQLADVYRKLLTLDAPLLAAVDGPAMGGAVGLALAADLTWVGPKALIAFPETKLGIVPALVSVVARRRMPPGKLNGLALTGLPCDADKSVELGLADFKANESARDASTEFAHQMIKQNSGEAMNRTKAFLRQEIESDLDKQLEAAIAEFKVAVSTQACAKGLDAFRNKAPLDWTKD